MMKKQIPTFVALTYLGILALLPFHAFLTTWAGSNFGHLDAWRIWKELIIVGSLPFVVYLIWTDGACRRWLKTAWLPRLIGTYMLLHLVWGLWALATGHVNVSALIYGLLANLRFVGFFVLVVLVAMRTPLLEKHGVRVVLTSGAVVVGFGLLQLLALPYDFLKHFGYGPGTIPAFQTVDNKLDYQRVQSTLRGANPLGAYLVVLISLVVAEWLSPKKRALRLIGYDLALIVVLCFTFSRSAYLGALASVAVLVWLSIKTRIAKKYVVLAAVAVLLVGLGGIFALRDNTVTQNALFHSDETSLSAESSNAGRVRALQNGVRDAAHEPFGRGPGTAGPASTRNNHPPRIAENYYLQIAQEVGWLGLGLFVAIVMMVAKLLWQRRQNWVAMGLLASLVGLSLVNLVSHAWADDTLGLLWWGLAGIAVSGGILKQNEATKTRKKRS